MKNLVVLSFLLIFQQIEIFNAYDLQTFYIDMPLDHFSFTSNRTFKLRYLIHDSYHTKKGPIFFYTGNEGDVTMFAQNTGFMFAAAANFGAAVAFAEHRYYGESLPFGNQSFSSPEKLGYLSSAQALADFVFVIDHLQQMYTKNVTDLKKLPVIAFGGSYGGMLSAWLRMKYPASVTGSIASSAPIWQFKDLTPCESYNKILTDVYSTHGSENCKDTIKKSWKVLRTIASSDTGKQQLSSTFSLCLPIKTDKDTDTFINWLTEIYSNIAMVNYPYAANFLAPLPANPVREFCQRLDSIPSNDNQGLLKAMQYALRLYTNYTEKATCNNITSSSDMLGEEGWDFQSCTEMIMPMCSIDQDMFENTSWDFQKFSDDCFKQFSVRPIRENLPVLEYGGKDLSAASNIIFSNGLLDPWSSGGVLGNVSGKVYAIVIPDAAHHLDLRTANPMDGDSVREARKFHESHISNWLNKFYVRYLKYPNEFIFYE